MARAITTITILQEGEGTPSNMSQEHQEAHVRNVERVMRGIAEGHITVELQIEEDE